MPQNVLVAVIGGGEYLPRMIRAILDKNVIPARNLFISSKSEAAKAAAEGSGAVVCEDTFAAVLKSEIVLLCASRREMATELAPLSQCIQKRILVTVCDDARVNVEFVGERVVSGTELIAATLHKDEDGKLSASYEIGKNVRLFLHQPCRDLVNAMCED
ncbi:NAD(P)-binding domain-containing protein [Butyricicoccus sp. Marseille-Q5471]|uniref:NAD(P)-binding domain-containing protein n=1 Tax=Butyricicoccus sp. Marseille-Q5471 TaxID=3039493 RepID=UPI0024BC63A5|nr:NAD(P)-binding domain-containing protein [Butyricicoccus sp. Marseille-Q5471]